MAEANYFDNLGFRNQRVLWALQVPVLFSQASLTDPIRPRTRPQVRPRALQMLIDNTPRRRSYIHSQSITNNYNSS